MKFEITNGSYRTKAFKVFGGTEDVRPGETKTVDVEVDVTEEFIDRMKRDGVAMKPAEAEKTKKESDDALIAKHHGGGKFNVLKGDDVLLSGLSKQDADAFNAMSDEDKAAYVEAEKAKA